MALLHSKKLKRSQRMLDWMYTTRSKVFSQSVLKTHAGLTSQVQQSQSKKDVQEQQTLQQQSEKDFRLSVFRDL